MFKFIIADLDENNLKSISNYIKQNFKYATLEKVFTKEKNFLNYFSSTSDYIIILELRFFSGNFYNKIKTFISDFPKNKLIIYGKINDIDYMKNLEEKFNVSYIVRPVKPTMLKNTIIKIMEEVEKEKGLTKNEIKIENIYKDNFNLFENIFLNSLIYDKINSEKEIKEAFEYLNISINNNFSVAIIRIDNFRKIIEDLSEKQKHILILKIFLLTKNFFRNSIVLINSFNQIVIIFNENSNIDENLSLLKELKIKIKIEININVSIGVGRNYNNLKDIKTSFNEASFALNHRFIMNKSSVIHIDYVEKENRYTARYPFEREQTLVYSAITGQFEYCIKILNQIFEVLKTSKEVYQDIISQFVMSIIISLNRNAAERNIEIDNNKFFAVNEISKLKSMDEAYDFLKLGLEKLCKYILQERKKDEDKIFEQMVNYINDKYYTSISYNSISNEIGFNSEYLKKIFEEKSKMSIIDYLHKVRIDKAKYLILNTELTDDVIAINLGYEDASMFRKIFKNVEGCLVGDFRYLKKDFKLKGKR